MAKKSASGSKKVTKVGKPSALIDTRVIYCGDNLEQLAKLPENCVDLIYIDPPFNSNRNYEVFWGETKEKRAFADRHASTQGYIEFMRPRCEELHRVLKKTGSFYFHCDWHASHYVKVMLDQIFDESSFQNEIVWKRTTAHNDPKRYGANVDSIFFYTKSNKYTWNTQYRSHNENYLARFRQKDPDGRRWQDYDLTAKGLSGGGYEYEYKGVTSLWRCPIETMKQLDEDRKLHFTSKGGIRIKRYLDENKGIPLQALWDDISPINSQAAEKLGYPTQKPLALLDRIIKASSNENDIILDAFCGCGTALVAADNLNRQWIGIDVSPTACRVMAKRMRDICGVKEDEKLWRVGRGFVVRDLPWSEKKLRELPPFEFENWAVIAIGGIPNKAQVGDMGIDGRIYPVSATPKKVEGELNFMDLWYPIQVKQKNKAGRPDIDSFEAVMMREDRTKGFFVSFDYTGDAMSEIDAFFKRTGKSIIALTVKDILEEQIAYKLA
ncbi:MAG: restriction endonuclease [Planctomycetes bacterium]|nr:restriction endonuclease [Planctomycetota bacterium]MBL7106543.1 restriction endonuclease [Phycisphaerae bacterium]